ncbi:MAG TPA: HPr-rel-A system PqqD family peptide chaperone [Actinomycetota bacterium]
MEPDTRDDDRRQAEGAEEPASEPLTVPADYVPVKASDVLELDMEDGFILFNHDSSLVHHLNPSAAIIWQLCDGSASVVELADDIADEFKLEPAEARGQVAGVVAEFEALGLVIDARRGDRGPEGLRPAS